MLVAIDFHCMEENAMEVNGYYQRFCYQHFVTEMSSEKK